LEALDEAFAEDERKEQREEEQADCERRYRSEPQGLHLHLLFRGAARGKTALLPLRPRSIAPSHSEGMI